MTRIEHLMTPEPVTIHVETTVEEASRLMVTCGLRHLPVVDAAGHLLGMISDRDLRGPLVGARAPGQGPVATDEIRSYMARDLVTAQPDEELGAVVRRIVDKRIGAVPVVGAGGELRGIVSYVDVLRKLADEADADAHALELMELI